VRDYLRSKKLAQEQSTLDLNQLAELGPQNLEQAWVYFKTWVKGMPQSESVAVETPDIPSTGAPRPTVGPKADQYFYMNDPYGNPSTGPPDAPPTVKVKVEDGGEYYRDLRRQAVNNNSAEARQEQVNRRRGIADDGEDDFADMPPLEPIPDDGKDMPPLEPIRDAAEAAYYRSLRQQASNMASSQARQEQVNSRRGMGDAARPQSPTTDADDFRLNVAEEENDGAGRPNPGTARRRQATADSQAARRQAAVDERRAGYGEPLYRQMRENAAEVSAQAREQLAQDEAARAAAFDLSRDDRRGRTVRQRIGFSPAGRSSGPGAYRPPKEQSDSPMDATRYFDALPLEIQQRIMLTRAELTSAANSAFNQNMVDTDGLGLRPQYYFGGLEDDPDNWWMNEEP
jgi:hypothetical protein